MFVPISSRKNEKIEHAGSGKVCDSFPFDECD
jgi:hypothetical protein